MTDRPAADVRPDVLPDSPHAWPDKGERVRAMFDRVARRYTRINTLTSFGRDAAWRRRAVALAAVQPADRLLDVCCGPGELADAFAAADPPPARIVACDFSPAMLAQAERRQGRRRRPIELVRADALALPFADGSFDLVSCAFGLRNLADAGRGLAEFARVLADGGRAVILEFSLPRPPLLRAGYQLYFTAILPYLAWLLGGDLGAYRYLPRSVKTFLAPARIADMLRGAGFGSVRLHRLTLGVATVYVARKGAAGAR